MGICPKKAVVTLNATKPGRLLTIPRGTETGAALEQIFDTGIGPLAGEGL